MKTLSAISEFHALLA